MEAKEKRITEEVVDMSREEAQNFNVNVKIKTGDKEMEYDGIKFMGFMLKKVEEGVGSTIISVGMSEPELLNITLDSIGKLKDTLTREALISLAKACGIDPALLPR